MSTKTKRLLRLYEEQLGLAYSDRTLPEYRREVRRFLEWLSEQDIELMEVRSDDVHTYQNELLAPIWSTNERLQQLADDGQLVTVFETRRLLEDDPGATLVAHLDGEIVRVEGDFDQLGDAPPPALTKIWFFRWIPGTGEPQCTN